MDFSFEDRKGNTGNKDSTVSDEVRLFFEEYDKGNTSGDLSFISDAFADSFFFCGPDGQQTVKREELLEILPKMQSFYQSIGLVSNRLTVVEAKMLDENYLQARGTWEMQFEKKDSPLVNVSIASTYLLFRWDGLRVVSQIDHQDLNHVLRTMKVLTD